MYFDVVYMCIRSLKILLLKSILRCEFHELTKSTELAVFKGI